ncbi:hypothetical protein BZA05DRAFT_330335 [Tricharina praecox]|uniref:uncharacterized protein n=1 Tax=Tricharina praecox TaxID=43433 RepID=UPI00222059A7|nr:uncharacterized protein BZA05DRAFT_330335 [Tricharina praecox]KAI5858940.1 hypothetical protein BZA05DRAFT_330335 [Tricharina praecox]
MELTLRESTDSVTSGRQGSPNSVHGLCRFFQAGCCTRGEKCWYKHELEIPTASETVAVSSTTTTTTTPSSTTTITTTTTTTTTPNASATADPSEVETCSICFDKPETYGLMTGCDHIFCLSCIRKWRCSSSTARNGRHDDPYADDPHALASTSKTCPLCRVRTRYIIPSVVFPTTTPQKKQIERVYRLRLSNIPCRYFVASLQPRAPPPRNESGLVPPHGRLSNAPWCPFGNECHYQHQKVPGVPYNFSESELARAMWGQRAAARRRAASRWGREGGGRASYGQEWVIRHIDDDDHTQHENTSTADADDDDSWDTADMAVLMAGLMEIHGPAADWGGDTTGVEAMDDFLATAFS